MRKQQPDEWLATLAQALAIAAELDDGENKKAGAPTSHGECTDQDQNHPFGADPDESLLHK